MPAPSKFSIFKERQAAGRRAMPVQNGNPMQKALEKKGF